MITQRDVSYGLEVSRDVPPERLYRNQEEELELPPASPAERDLGVELLLTPILLLLAIAPSYDRKDATGGWLFWLSPLADPLAVLRIFLSAFHTPKQWRGRKYGDDVGQKTR